MTWDEAWHEVRRELVQRYGDPGYTPGIEWFFIRVLNATDMTLRDCSKALGYYSAHESQTLNVLRGRLCPSTLIRLEKTTGIPRAWLKTLSAARRGLLPTQTQLAQPDANHTISFQAAPGA